ncbi:phosphoglucomutase [Dyadobacter sp. BE34]|uniref:Phosphoglucomutase n=1 Tax=Dyadobacter fermentans TaxID=94254 RepID=A0ABU1QS04_9BACT|nr:MULTISPECIES: phospho-sugar mutase [Dyadobacter]MDR6803941.1 phosphoglucomutase [Dyadobacter fermentans]MDR7041681.1 phosphoglucomutase [Dyadobacter sp. BE242]MDR7196084.1 phosphoglucomutase [Dyadobacter sp. BE34]MDR7213371.1 phosphoglucomutase [Dyadobacter sp. BE31]MDR7261490.1 phosphoglucomutase [Dyadobacter sp. BE32]
MTAKLEPNVMTKVSSWLNGDYDIDTKQSIQQLIDEGNDTELTDAFYKDLEFGTGGLRGLIGIGSNRMNRYTVGTATQGLANYLNKAFPNEAKSVAVAYDSRIKSDEFAKIIADIFSANGISVYLFEGLRPTPELSFAIRLLGCKSGVVVTASHNPKEYNGYKAYWTDGSQVVAPHDTNIINEVNAITSIDQVKFDGDASKITKIGTEVDEKYINHILSLSISKGALERQKDLKIVYTPLHGTGVTLVPQLLAKMGFEAVTMIEEQAEPKGNGQFPTVVYPNPEESEAMSKAVEKAKEIDADLVMGTDPDSDRVGIAVKNHHGEIQLLNGNQTASVLIYYLLNAWKDAGKLTGTQFVCKTIVTTDLIDKMAAAYDVKCYNTLTGFKYIAQVIREKEGQEQFIGGGEESYGYLIGDAVRDKDAIASCAMIAELTAYAKDKGLSLFDMLMEIYKQFGFYYEGLISLTKKGKSGADEIQQMMADFRANPPKTIAGSPVVRMDDYKALTTTDFKSGNTVAIPSGEMGIESSNVLQFFTEDGTKFTCRPSGTEPKIKFYVGVRAALEKNEDFDSVYASLKEKVKAIGEELNLK